MNCGTSYSDVDFDGDTIMFVNPGSRGLGRTYTTTTSCNRRERMCPGGDAARDDTTEMRIDEELTSAPAKARRREE